MKIHYTATVWHGGFYKYFSNALKSLGHEVVFFDDSGSRWQKNLERIMSRFPKMQYFAKNRFYKVVSRDWLASVKACAPDLLIMQHINILADYVAEARKLKIPTFCWIDSPPGGAQAQEVIASYKFADKIFSVDRKWMTILYSPKDFIHLPLAGEPSVFQPLDIRDEQKKYDVVFVGSMPPQSGSGYLRAAIAAGVPEKFSVAVFGNGANYWTKYFPILKKRIRAGVILDDTKINEIYNQSKIVLNIHAIGHISSLSARTYEIALAGAFQLIDYREDLDVVLSGNNIVSFRSAAEINPLIEEWLGKPEKRTEIAQKTRELVLARHTWRHRAEEMLKYFHIKQ